MSTHSTLQAACHRLIPLDDQPRRYQPPSNAAARPAPSSEIPPSIEHRAPFVGEFLPDFPGKCGMWQPANFAKHPLVPLDSGVPSEWSQDVQRQSSSASLRLFPRIFPRPQLLHTALHQGLQERFEGRRHTEARHGTSGESQGDSGDSAWFHQRKSGIHQSVDWRSDDLKQNGDDPNANAFENTEIDRQNTEWNWDLPSKIRRNKPQILELNLFILNTTSWRLKHVKFPFLMVKPALASTKRHWFWNKSQKIAIFDVYCVSYYIHISL